MTGDVGGDDLRYCPNCGQDITPGSQFCRRCGDPLPEPEEVAPDSEDTDDAPDGQQGQYVDTLRGTTFNDTAHPPSRYARLFGDVYWDKRSWAAKSFFLLMAVFALLPRDTFFRWVGQLIGQEVVVQNYGAFQWLYLNYYSLSVFFLGAGVVASIALDPPIQEGE